jgi:cyclophilin family peptidyl-prolyl cis-trans isomerase/HEAT repeat protein
MRPVLVWLALAASAAACAPKVRPVPPAPAAPTWEQKLAAILRLEDARLLRESEPAAPAATAATPEVRGDLVALLGDREGRARRRAALAVGRVGLAEGIDPLAALLTDGDPEVRQMAAFALGLIGDSRATDALVAALGDPDRLVQGRAAQALGTIGATSAAPRIGQLVADRVRDVDELRRLDPDTLESPLTPGVECFRLGLYALVRLKAWDAVAAAVLDAKGEPVIGWWPVAYAMQRLEDVRAVPALLWFARAQAVEPVVFVARGLGQLKERRGVDALIPLVAPGPRDERVRAAAARALGLIGDPRAIAPLTALLQDRSGDDNVRLEAVEALGALRAREAIPLILDEVSSPWPAMRAQALRAVARIDPETLLLVLSGRDADPHWAVRAEVSALMPALGAERAAPVLALFARDDDARVRAAAVEALVDMGSPGVDEVLAAALGDDDFVLRATAARLIARRKTTSAMAALAAAYERSKRDESYVARAAILAALAGLDAAAAEPLLRDAVADPDWAVRRRAANLLRSASPAAERPGIRPAPTRLPRAAYDDRALVSPPFSPRAYVDTTRGPFVIELAVNDAPLTVRNFIDLVGRGFFDGVAIHRVVPTFVVQDGDPRGDGEGGPGYTIRDELNDRPYLRGTVGMALDWADTGGSQFFVTLGPQPHLDARYTVFGHVIDGLATVDRLRRFDVIERVRVWDGMSWTEGPGR